MNEQKIPQSEQKYSVEDYLRLEKKEGTKHEFYNGRVLPKSGLGRKHNLICSNMTVAIGSRILGQKYEVSVNGIKVRLNSRNFTYPDLVVVSANPQFDSNETDILLNPTVIVEVISGKTQTNDKTEKLEGYLSMDSVRECLLVKENELKVEQYAKQNPKQWMYKIYDGKDEIISLDAINCKISLAEIYSQINMAN